MERLKIGISIGDINGIGLEVIIKTLAQEKILDYCTPIVYGSSKVVSYHKNIVGAEFHFNSVRSAQQAETGKINIVNCWQDNVNITLGKPSDMSGMYAFKSLEAAVADLKSHHLEALVTAPISKEAMNLANFPFIGHTEYITDAVGAGESLMFMVSDNVRIGVATNHIPVSEVAHQLNKELLLKKIALMNETLKVDFGIERPSIAVLGLNPHASDNGLIGDEEERIIRPAVVECKKKGMIIVGPMSADGFFGSGEFRKYDGILAMYHDQGLIPFKLLSFGSGVNFTAGLSIVRTSPDHGTTFELAGKNEADPASFRQAMFLAIDIARSRMAYTELKQNALVIKEKPAELEGEEAVFEDEENAES